MSDDDAAMMCSGCGCVGDAGCDVNDSDDQKRMLTDCAFGLSGRRADAVTSSRTDDAQEPAAAPPEVAEGEERLVVRLRVGVKCADVERVMRMTTSDDVS